MNKINENGQLVFERIYYKRNGSKHINCIDNNLFFNCYKIDKKIGFYVFKK